MADRIGVIAAGKLIAQGTLDELRRQVGHQAGQDTGHGGGTLEDTFLTLVAEQPQAA
jgi:ABC-2 type transport system ATP-binding protein